MTTFLSLLFYANIVQDWQVTISRALVGVALILLLGVMPDCGKDYPKIKE